MMPVYRIVPWVTGLFLNASGVIYA